MKRLSDKTALVTGAGSGIGEAVARAMAREGAKVVIADINVPAGEAVALDLARLGAEVSFTELDVAEESSWDRLQSKLRGELESLDVLVNAAGVFAEQRHPFDSITFAEWRRIMAVNLDGVFLGTRFGLGMMKTRQRGSIVNIGSVAGQGGSRGGGAYGASKGGVQALTKHAAYSAARAGYGVRVNCVRPGYVWTPGVAGRARAEFGAEEEARKALAARNPLNVEVSGMDIAWAVIFLASDEAQSITGTEIDVDGGLLATLWGVP